MKKQIAVFVCFAVMTVSIFAEGLFTVSMDAARDALFLRSFTGEFADAEAAERFFPYQGGSEIKSFQTSNFDEGLEAALILKYANESFGGLMTLKALGTESIDLRFSDWEIWLRLGPWFDTLGVKALTGNQAQRGKIQQYENFDDFLTFRNDYLGLMIPVNTMTSRIDKADNLYEADFPYGYGAQGAPTGYANFIATDSADLFTPAGTIARLSGILFDIETKPVTITASVGGLYEQLARPFTSSWKQIYYVPLIGQYDPADDRLFITTDTGFGLRAESSKIANMVTVAGFYKYAGIGIKKEAVKDETNELRDVINAKSYNHEFGLHATLEPLDKLGISFGYTGLYQYWENAYNTDVPPPKPDGMGTEDYEKYWRASYYKNILPFYNGVDLRFCYTGIKKLSLTFNNNVTFSKVTGSHSNEEQFMEAWIYQRDIAGKQNRSESYFGLYNALGLQYMVTDTFTADLQAANRLGFFSLKWEEEGVTSVSDNLGIYAGVKYSITFKPGITASIRGGFSLALRSYTYQYPTTKNKFKAGYVDFGIPIGVKVEY